MASMQRFTVKISFQPGRKLGFVLVDHELDLDEPYYESDDLYDEDEDCLYPIRGGGGGGSTIEIDDSTDGENEAQSNFGGLSLNLEFDAEAEAAAAARAAQGMATVIPARAAQGRVVPLPPGPPPVNNKRKRPTSICVSNNSIVFQFAQQLLAETNTSSSTAIGGNQGENMDESACRLNAFDPSNVDALIEWGRNNIPPIEFRNGSIPFEVMNEDVLKFVLTGAISPWDAVEKIQYTRHHQPPKIAKVQNYNDNSSKSYRRKRRCRPYLRADHFTTFNCEDKPSSDLADMLRSPQNYPLYITFIRPNPVLNATGMAEVINSPPRKRLKTSASNIGARTNNQQSKDEVICLLDSSDEEEEDEVKTDAAAQIDGGGAKMDGADDAVEINSSTDNSSSNLLPQLLLPPPDPPLMPFHDDDFVLTPYGPGKILSLRVERYASSAKHSDATIFKPTVIYSINLQYGTCHIPASQVKPISGTSYTEKTLITYQRVPITGHDLLRLRPMTYLNDSIINFYFKYLKSQYDQNNKSKAISEGRGWDDLDGEGIHIFPSFCYTRIKSIMGTSTRNSKMVRTKIWKDLKSWTKGIDIFKKKLLIFPINEHLHWTCVFVFHPGRPVRKHAKDLKGKEGNAINLKAKTTTSSASNSTSNPVTNTSNINVKENVSNSAAGPGEMAMKSFSGGNDSRKESMQAGADVHASEGHPQNNHTADKTQDSASRVGRVLDYFGASFPIAATETETTNSADDGDGKRNCSDTTTMMVEEGGDGAVTSDAAKAEAGENDDGKRRNVSNHIRVAENTESRTAAANTCNDKKESVSDRPAIPGDMAMKPFDGGIGSQNDSLMAKFIAIASENQPQNNHTANETKVTKSNPVADNAESKPMMAKPNQNLGSNSQQELLKAEVNALASESQPQNDHSTNKAQVTNGNQVKGNAESKPTMAKPNPNPSGAQVTNGNQVKDNAESKASTAKPRVVWQCDFCWDAKFDIFEDAVAHENTCDKNPNFGWCMVHFDSGRHFKLHKSSEITGNIRKYLNAYYEAEYASSHPGLSSFTTKNMPAFSAPVLQQDNTKDCGVFMLENAERVLRSTPKVDANFVKTKGANKMNFFGSNSYDKYVIEKKRDDILQLIQTMRRGENKID